MVSGGGEEGGRGGGEVGGRDGEEVGKSYLCKSTAMHAYSVELNKARRREKSRQANTLFYYL